MLLITDSLPTPAENLAWEEAWLDMAEAGQWHEEVLRLWQPTSPFVVIGRGSRIAQEVNLAATSEANIPVYRRISGGAAIVAGSGCLMYAVLLSYSRRPHFRLLDQAHSGVMDTIVKAISEFQPAVAWKGTCDVVVDNRKVSGNSLRCRRDWLLYHGTLLLDMDLAQVDRYLLHPPREPEYRQQRPHSQFIANLNLPTDQVIDALGRAWQASPQPWTLPHAHIEHLVRQRYHNRDWNYER